MHLLLFILGVLRCFLFATFFIDFSPKELLGARRAACYSDLFSFTQLFLCHTFEINNVAGRFCFTSTMFRCIFLTFQAIFVVSATCGKDFVSLGRHTWRCRKSVDNNGICPNGAINMPLIDNGIEPPVNSQVKCCWVKPWSNNPTFHPTFRPIWCWVKCCMV